MQSVAILLVLVLALLGVDVYMKTTQLQRSQVVLQVKEQELNAARSTKTKATRRAEEQAAKRAALEAQYKVLGASFDSATYTNAQLQAKLSPLVAANSSLTDRVRSSRSQLRQIAQELTSLQSSKYSLDVWATKAREQMHMTEIRMGELQKELTAARREAAAAHRKARQLISEMGEPSAARVVQSANSQSNRTAAAQQPLALPAPRPIKSSKRIAKEIDYEQYWRDASAAAMAALEKQREVEEATRSRLARWPKVYIYQLPAELMEGWNPDEASEESVFGKTVQSMRSWDDLVLSRRRKVAPLSPLWWKNMTTARRMEMAQNVRDTNHYGFALALTYRLWKSTRYRTMDPDAADLFLVPLLPRPKRGRFITAACLNLTADKVTAALPHLNEANAHTHVFPMAKEHYEGSKCPGWWADPTGLFRNVQRLSYSTAQPESTRADDYYKYERKIAGLPKCNDLWQYKGCPHYPNVESAPYISNVHWPPTAKTALTPPWADESGARPFRMVLLGGVTHGDTKVRKRVKAQCNGYRDASKCLVQRYDFATLLLKYQSTFCLEPAGDSPFRRSTTDSIAFGCIPVFFSAPQEDAYNWLWSGWRRAASVRVNRTLYLDGKIDLHRLLNSAPPELIMRMRHTLAQHARAFTMSLEDDPGDEVHLLVHGAVEAAKRLGAERKGSARFSAGFNDFTPK